jgi:hypothetical protein
MSSSYPAAGSVYHWSWLFAPSGWEPVISYFCGGLNFFTLIGFSTTTALNFSTYLRASLNYYSTEDPYGEGIVILITMIVIIIQTGINVTRIRF